MMETIKKEAEPIKRLQQVLKLISQGNWYPTSFNYLLFAELIKGIPGYEQLADTEKEPVIVALRRLLVDAMERTSMSGTTAKAKRKDAGRRGKNSTKGRRSKSASKCSIM